MRYSLLSLLLIIGSLATGFLACQSNDVAATERGSLRLIFDNVMGDQDLSLTTNTYKNELGESFTVTKFNYFVSNFRLRREDGTEYVLPQDNNYFLIEEGKPASQTVTLANVPVGNYTALSFLIGIDSTRSMADLSQRTGVLDPGSNNGMYWDWNSGYIFLKLEGTSALAPAAQNNAFFYHVGGFGRANVKINNLRTVSVPFKSDLARMQPNATLSIGVITDAMKMFNGSTKLSIAQHSSVMFEPYSTSIADNYVHMFSYKPIQTNP